MNLQSNQNTTDCQPSTATDATLGMAALAYARAGYRIFPCAPGDKTPLRGSKWNKQATMDETTIKRWWYENPDANIGLPMAINDLVAVDIDTSRGADRSIIPAAWWQSAIARSGAEPVGDDGYSYHIIFKARPGAKYRGKLAEHIDIKHKGYIVVEPSIHPSGRRYEWLRSPDDHPPMDAPTELEASTGGALVAVAAPNRLETLSNAELGEFRELLKHKPADDYELWVNVGMALCGVDGGFELWHQWSQASDKYAGIDECRRKWATFKPSLPGEGLTYRSVRALLEGDGADPSTEQVPRKRGRPKGSTSASNRPRTPKTKSDLMAQLKIALEQLPIAEVDDANRKLYGRIIKSDLGADGLMIFKDWALEGGQFTDAQIDEEWQSFPDESPEGSAIILHAARKAASSEMTAGDYEKRSDGFYYIKYTADGIKTIKLSNFTATITAELNEDDGEHATEGAYLISGEVSGAQLPEIRVPCVEYEAMKWVETQWRGRATVMAGYGCRDHLRAAIKLSSNPSRIPVYKHTGWRRIDDRWVYLHAGGGIDEQGQVDDIQCSYSGELAKAVLPDPPHGDALLNCVDASYWTRAVMNDEPAGLLVMLAPYAAVLDEMLGLDFGIWFVGPPRSKKSAVTAIIQGHFGLGFAKDRWMASWTSTDNALEAAAHRAKDMPFVIDDYRPEQSRFDDLAQQKKADRIFRGKHNHAGRERMRADTSSRPVYTPRGLPISSAEALPQSQSLRQRLITLEFDGGSVHVKSLTDSQDCLADGKLAGAMAGFIQWVAPRVDGYKQKLKDAKRRARDYIRAKGINDRSADQAAYLVVTAMVFYKYADDCGLMAAWNAEWPEHFTVQDVLDRGGWCSYSTEVHKAIPLIIDLFKSQESVDAEADPVCRFISTLGNALESGAAYVSTDLDGKVAPKNDYGRYGWKDCMVTNDEKIVVPKDSNSQHIGFIKNGALWLMPDATFMAVQQILSRHGEPLVISKARLYKTLKDNGLLARSDSNRPSTVEPFSTCDRYENRRVIALKLSTMDIDLDQGN
jgi:hypothetical protein